MQAIGAWFFKLFMDYVGSALISLLSDLWSKFQRGQKQKKAKEKTDESFKGNGPLDEVEKDEKDFIDS